MRSTLLLFTVLLAMATLAGAATAPAQAPAFLAPSCAANASTLNPPGLVPNPILTTSVCGSCSLSPCQGRTVNSICFAFNRQGTCQPPNSDLCPGTTTWSCQCYFGPL
jgi:hypothetical protein